jgi:hypothetical protein
MARTRLAWLALVAVFFFGGCAQVPKQAFNRAANHDVKKVVILKPPALEEYLVQNLGHPGMGFGLVGGLIAAADIQSKTNDFTAKMKELNYDPREEITGALAKELSACGYEVTVMDVARPKPAILDSYDDIDAKLVAKPDAYVDLVLNWSGYFTASPTADYIPTVRALVRVVKRQSKEIAYQELINYGYEMRRSQAINLTANGGYSFHDFKALMAEPARALEGMRLGIPLIAHQVSRDIAPEGYVAPADPAAPPLAAPVVQPVSSPASPPASGPALPAPGDGAPAAQPAVLRPQ